MRDGATGQGLGGRRTLYGYRSIQREDIEGNHIFLAKEDGGVSGYLFSHIFGICEFHHAGEFGLL